MICRNILFSYLSLAFSFTNALEPVQLEPIKIEFPSMSGAMPTKWQQLSFVIADPKVKVMSKQEAFARLQACAGFEQIDEQAALKSSYIPERQLSCPALQDFAKYFSNFDRCLAREQAMADDASVTKNLGEILWSGTGCYKYGCPRPLNSAERAKFAIDYCRRQNPQNS